MYLSRKSLTLHLANVSNHSIFLLATVFVLQENLSIVPKFVRTTDFLAVKDNDGFPCREQPVWTDNFKTCVKRKCNNSRVITVVRFHPTSVSWLSQPSRACKVRRTAVWFQLLQQLRILWEQHHFKAGQYQVFVVLCFHEQLHISCRLTVVILIQ